MRKLVFGSVVSGVMLVPMVAMATPTIDLSGIVAAVDAADVIAAIVSVAAVLAVVLWGRKAIRFTLGLIGR